MVGSRPLFRGRQAVQSKCYACNEYGRQFFVDDVDNPYTTGDGKPFDWLRGRQASGRTITWGRQVYRLSDYELKAASRDGYGDEWPIPYAELAADYDTAEHIIGASAAYGV